MGGCKTQASSSTLCSGRWSSRSCPGSRKRLRRLSLDMPLPGSSPSVLLMHRLVDKVCTCLQGCRFLWYFSVFCYRVCLLAHLVVCLSFRLSVSLSIRLSICLSVCLLSNLPACLPTHLLLQACLPVLLHFRQPAAFSSASATAGGWN